jgi:hypothetical protein
VPTEGGALCRSAPTAQPSSEGRSSAIGAKRAFANVRIPMSGRAKRRAGRSLGSDGLASAARRLPCATRLRAVRHNSLRSLRSLRSDRVPQVRSRSALCAPAQRLRCSAAPIRPESTPPVALPVAVSVFGATNTNDAAEARGRLGAGATVRSRAAQQRAGSPARSAGPAEKGFMAAGRSGPRAEALRSRRAVRAAQGTRSEAQGKHSEPRRQAALGPAPAQRMRTLNVRFAPRADDGSMRRGSRRARWSN